jgi:hypothetical protein
MQHKNRMGCGVGQLRLIGSDPEVPHPHGAGEMIEREP